MPIGQIPWNKGLRGIYSPEAIEKNRLAHIGKPAWNKGISDNITHKICTKCKELKSIDNFAFIKKGRPLRIPMCRSCTKKTNSEYRSSEHGKAVIRRQFKRRYNKHADEYINKATDRYFKKPEAVRAAAQARYALKKGLIEKKACENCSSDKVEMHHDDYSRPLEIRWLCRSCHMKEHKHLKERIKP